MGIFALTLVPMLKRLLNTKEITIEVVTKTEPAVPYS